MTLHFLNDVANDAESTQKIENYVIIASLKSIMLTVFSLARVVVFGASCDFRITSTYACTR